MRVASAIFFFALGVIGALYFDVYLLIKGIVGIVHDVANHTTDGLVGSIVMIFVREIIAGIVAFVCFAVGGAIIAIKR